MNTHISLLRGINVSGKRLIKMDALSALYNELGFTGVKTYIQSGNVVFQTTETNTGVLAEKISAAIKTRFDFDVPVLVLSAKELEMAATSNPYVGLHEEKFLHVTFLADLPTAENWNKIEAEAYLPDAFQVIEKCIYLHTPNGYGNTKLNNTFFENKLKVSATTRNWKTVQTLWGMSKEG